MHTPQTVSRLEDNLLEDIEVDTGELIAKKYAKTSIRLMTDVVEAEDAEIDELVNYQDPYLQSFARFGSKD